MKKQFDNYTTFFDAIFCDELWKEKIYTPVYYLGNSYKKRTCMNLLVCKYLLGNELTATEKKEAENIITGEIYKNTNKRNDFHCILCSEKFQREDMNLFSKKFKYWNLCIPTHPYSPGGLMVYLKDRTKEIGDIQELSDEMVKELIEMINDLYNLLKEKMRGFDLVGVNVLFQQISRSQKCIHGHIELMFKNAHLASIGCEIIDTIAYDELAGYLNFKIKDRIENVENYAGISFLENCDLGYMKETIKVYQENMEYLIKIGREIQKHQDISLVESQYVKYEILRLLQEKLSPAPILYVYLTNICNKTKFSIIPEMILEPVDLSKINLNNEIDLYTLKINQYLIKKKDILFRQPAPMMRQSIKLSGEHKFTNVVKELTKSIKNILEGEL